LSNFIINIQYSLNDSRLYISNIFWEFSIEISHKLRENVINYIFIQVSICNNIEMTYYSVCDESTSSSRWAHSCQNDKSLQFHPLKIFTIVPTFVIKILPDQLNWRLSSKLLFLRHIEIIDKNYTLFANWRTIDSFSQFI
jgi:hypothetical protein